MTNLARHFSGTLRLSDQEVKVAISTVGDQAAPDLIVTGVRSDLGLILKPAFNGDRWWIIHKTSRDMSAVYKRALEQQINKIIQEKGRLPDYQLRFAEVAEVAAA